MLPDDPSFWGLLLHSALLLWPFNAHSVPPGCHLYPSVQSSTASTAAPLRMYSFMGGGLFCAIVGNILLVVSTATDYWMQYRLSGSFAHQGLWRYCMSGKCYMQTDSIGKYYHPVSPPHTNLPTTHLLYFFDST